MSSPKQMSSSLLQAFFWWTSRNMWRQQEAALWRNRWPSRNGFYSLLEQSIQEILESLSMLLWLAVLCSGTCELTVLVCWVWSCFTMAGAWVCRLGGCPHCPGAAHSPALRWPEGLGSCVLKFRSKPMFTLVQAEELPSNSTKWCGCISTFLCARCLAHTQC